MAELFDIGRSGPAGELEPDAEPLAGAEPATPGPAASGLAASGLAASGPDGSARDLARKRVEKRRNLEGGVVAYVVVNAFLVGVWALTGRGYFWPVWVMGGWGVGMVLGVWDYLRGPVTDADIDAELHRRPSDRSRR